MFIDKTLLILKRDDLGRVRMPRERRAMLVREFQRCGLPASKFAQLAEVRYHTFWNWLREHGLTVAKVVRTTLEKHPQNATLWSTRSMAGKLGL